MIAKRPLILIVDDAPEDIAIYKRHLTRGSGRRYKIQEAATGVKALTICRRRPPDCVLLDFRLPDLNGLEILQALAGETGTLPCAVVMLTEVSDTQLAVDAMKFGAHDFLEKNWITPEMLQRAIANAIEKAALQREVEEQRRELAIKNDLLEQRLADLQREVNERRQVEAALRVSEERLRLTLSFAGMGAWDWDPVNNREVWSAEHFKIMGYPEMPDGAEVPVEWWSDRIHPDDRERCLQALQEARANGACYNLEHRIVRADDGRVAWLDVRGRFLRDERGGPTRLLGVAQDITERKQTEEALAASERRFKRLIEALPGVVWMSDETGSITFMNERWTDLTGLTLEQSLGDGWLVAVNPDDTPRLEAEWKQAIASGAPVESRHRYWRRDGGCRWHLCRAVPLRDEIGVVREWVGVSIDIHDRYEAERALGESETRYRALVEATSQLVWTADENGISDISWKWWSRVTGVPSGRLTRGRWLETVHPEDRQALRAIWRQSRDRQSPFEIEFRLRARGGEYRHFSVRGVPLFTGDAFNGWIGTLDDVTDRRRAEDALKLANERFILAEAASNGYIYDWNTGSGHIERSARFNELLGYSEGEAVEAYDWWKRQLHPDDVRRVSERLDQKLRGRKPGEADGYSLEYRLRHNAGDYLWVLDRGKLIRDDAGRVTRVIGISVDITRQKRIENSLRESESRLKLAISALNGGTWEWDLGADEVGWSDELYEVFGKQPGSFTPTVKSWLKNVVPEDRARAEAVIEAFRRGEDAQLEYRTTWPEGELRWLDMRGVTMPDEQGRPASVLGVITDITRRKLAEEALRESEARVHTLAANLSDGMIYQTRRDPDGVWRFLYVSDSVERVKGVKAEDVLADANTIYNLIPEDYRGRLREAEEASLREMTDFRFDAPFLLPNGELRWSRISSAPRRLSDGSVVWDGVEIDITERKRTEEALRESEEKFSKAFKASPHRITISTVDEGRYVDVNDAVLKATGYKREEMIGRKADELRIYAEPEGRDKLLQAFHGESVRDLEFRLRTKNGDVRTILTSAEIITLGGQRCILTISNDITERKQAEEKLRESEERFRTLANTVPSIIWTAEPGGAITFHNQQWLDYSGVSLGQNGDWLRLVIHPADVESCLAEWTRASELGREFETELRLRRRDGEYRWFLVRATPVCNSEGEVATWFGTSTDIHDRRQVEEALRESEERLKLAMEAAGMFVWETDVASGRVKSDFPEQMMGMAPGSFGGTFNAFLALVHPDDRDSLIETRNRALKGEGSYDLELRTLRPDGGVRWGLVRGVVHHDEQGRPQRIVGVDVDITEHKRIEEALRLSEERYRLLVRTSSHVVITADEAGHDTDSGSDWWEELTGQARTESRNHGWMKCVHPDDYEATAATWRKAIAEQTPFEAEFRIRARGGDYLWLRATGAPIRDAGGAFREWAVALRDITERKQAEEKLREQEKFIQSLIDTVPAGIYIYDIKEGRNIFINPRLANQLGYEPSEIQAMGSDFLSLLFHPEDHDVASAHFKTLKKAPDGVVSDVEYRMKDRDGQWRWFISRELVFTRDEDGRPRQILGAAQEITDRKRDEEALQRANRRYHLALNVLDGYVYEYNVSDKISERSKGFAKLTGYEPEEVPPEAEWWFDLVHQDDRGVVFSTVEGILDEESVETTYSFEYRIRQRDGNYIDVLDRGLIVRDEEGRPAQVVGAIINITERKQAEVALRESAEHLRLAMDAANAGSFDWDVASGAIVWSPQHLSILGLELGLDENSVKQDYRAWRDIVHPEDLGWVEADIAKTLIERRDLNVEYRIVRSDGAVRWVSTIGHTFYNDAGDPVRMRGLMIDTTERKQAEERLRESEERLRLTLQSAQAGVWEVKFNPHRSYWSEEYQALYGFSEDEKATREKWASHVHPDDLQRVEEANEALINSDRDEMWQEYRIVHPERGERWVLDLVRVRRDASGRAIGLGGINLDVTDRKRAEEALRESEERFRQMVETITDVFWVADPVSGAPIYVSPAYERLWLRPAAELYGNYEEWIDTIHPEDRERVRKKHLTKVLEGSYDEIYRVVRPDGSAVWVHDRGFPVCDEAGHVRHIVGVAEDITDRKRIEDELRESQRRYAALAEAVPQLVWTSEPDGGMDYFNQRWYAYTGTTPDRVLNRQWQSLIHPGDRERVDKAWRKGLRSGELIHVELRLCGADGSYRWFIGRGVPYKDERRGPVNGGTSRKQSVVREGENGGNGAPMKYEKSQVIKWFGTFTDIHDLKMAEAALRESEERTRRQHAELENIYQAAPVGLSLMDRDFRIIRINETLAKIDGISPSESLGRTMREVLPELADRLEPICRQVIKTGRPIMNLDIHGVTPRDPGIERDWLASYYPVKGQDGSVQGIGAVVLEITARKQAEERVRESEERLRLAAQAAGFGLYNLDLQTGENYWSPELLQIFGLPNGDAVMMDKLPELVHPDDREETIRAIEASLDPRGSGEFEIERRALRSDGSVRWILARGKTLFRGKGRKRAAARIIGVAFDITERKEAEEKLHASEDLFRTIFDLSGIGILQIEPSTGRFLRANREFCNWLGYSEAELLKMSFGEITYPDDRKIKLGGARMFMRGESDEYITEMRCVRKDGGVVWGLVTSRMLRDGAGRPLRTVTAVQDITRRRKFEDDLMQSKERYRNLIETANEGIWLLDAEANTNYVNERMASLLGYTADEINGRKVPEFCFEQDMSKAVELVNAILKGGYQEFDFRFRRKDGGELYVLVSTSPVYDTQGAIVGAMGMFTDITERKRAEEALRESERRLKLSLTAGRAGTWEWRIKEDKLIWSDEYFDLFGLKPGDLDPKVESFLLCIHPDDRDRMLAEMSDVLQERKDAEHEFRFIRPGGGVRWAQTNAQLTLDESGEPERLVGITIDITERKEAEMEREDLLRKEQEARAQAEAANRGKDEFVAMVSHELRSPLNAMLGWAKILKKGGIDTKTQTHALDVIERSARLQQNLIEDLLDMARIVGGKLRLETRPVNLTRVVEAAADVVRPAASAKEIDLRLSIKSADEVTGDTDRLQQVVWNLLSNAVKFTPHGGRVEVILERVGPSAQIIVTDTGRGIKAEDLPFIFDRFRQADSSSTRRFAGLGLGLALVKHMVELHGGQVSADSIGEGQGASFTVKLPVRAVRGEAVKQEDVVTRRQGDKETKRQGDRRNGRLDENAPLSHHFTDPPPPHLSLNGVWALIVDDEADARELVATLLSHYGARVTAASCAVEALDKLREGEAGMRPDVLVSDISMPDEDGYMLIERVRGLPPEEGGKIPAIALTAFERPSDRIKALASGFSMHVPKPVEPEELAMVIANLTGHPGKRMNVR